MKNKVLVTGGTGNTGGHVIENLLSQGIPVRALVRKIDERSDALAARGVEIVEGDLTDLDAVTAALKDIKSAFFVYTIKEAGILDATAYFAQAAYETGVEAIVNLSQFGANRHVKSHGAQNHWIAERLFDRAPVPVTHLRPTLFAEWFMYQAMVIRSESKYYLPFGDAKFAPIATEDIARVAAAILADPAPHAGKSYDLFGPKILSMAEIAEIFTSVLERPVTYVPIDTETFIGILKKFLNAGPYFIQHVTSLGQDLADGREAGMNDLVEQLTGQKPLQMADYILKNKAAFA
ncbi:NmrA family NAD(P)-binding protein [Mucilaginibacter celer]|uniref:NAD-dependent epimerase/dehydratase family protein n=1 Tax=Mucilaginibacter celer TaxID=2305508 RepID=A0A494VTN3_9SPHI|nr:NmrA family NAD(P)-binding protein [Mucilaginibacter celer]AYL94302.1 NAD-dependent epimerase/dehydratase family protein [Mucilaginibacter celer]